ncbi:TPA: mechanosensitive ion channel family protein [Candidatus Woesearchaeota archaeon]|nr:MscS Mechanosensitive ion channel [archaeon GW2011_AR15]MBS3103986.1 mechanosensitive ion channel family protein [Candidatus Woesearchaeota archaeon]HIH40946.1 mechanosensitive ion channel family protein [Candidatus Woesearchaeota archaeon]
MGFTNLTAIADSVDNYMVSAGINEIHFRAGIVLLTFLILGLITMLLFKVILKRLVQKTKTDFDDKVIDATQMPVLLLVIMSGIFFSGKMLDLDMSLQPYFSKIYLSIVSYLLFLILLRVVLLIVHRVREVTTTRKVKVFEDKVFPVFEKSLKVLMVIVYIFVFFHIWAINFTPLLASAGILGLAIAFAAQSTIANIFGGISLFLDKTYEIGDYIIVDDKDRGEIIDLGLRSTKIRTTAGVLITIPNSIMANTKVVNESGINPKIRIHVEVGVSYDSDLDKVEKLLLDMAGRSDYVEKNPEPHVRFRNFGDSGITLQYLFWIKDPSYKGIYTSLAIKEIHKKFREEGIEIPYPKRDLYIKKSSEIKVKK